VLELATKDFETLTSLHHRTKTFFMILWFRSERFARRRMNEQD
jgi:hypothetical protein